MYQNHELYDDNDGYENNKYDSTSATRTLEYRFSYEGENIQKYPRN